jgi:hypothetical protein
MIGAGHFLSEVLRMLECFVMLPWRLLVYSVRLSSSGGGLHARVLVMPPWRLPVYSVRLSAATILAAA